MPRKKKLELKTIVFNVDTKLYDDFSKLNQRLQTTNEEVMVSFIKDYINKRKSILTTKQTLLINN